MELKFSAVSKPECEDFLKIRTECGSFQTIDEFIQEHPNVSEGVLSTCVLSYRGKEIPYKAFEKQYTEFSESMDFVRFQRPMFIPDRTINAAAYFTKKAIECLEFARFFTMKSALLLDTDYNLRWAQGYVPQFLFRCMYFGTATTWFSNAFDHILQSIYWAKELYTLAEDREGVPYNEGWDVKTTMQYCTYEFVVCKLKTRGLLECRKHLTECFSKIEEVRKWANYIKHKGGIDYHFLEADSPYELYYIPAENNIDNGNPSTLQPVAFDEKYAIKDFKSPIEIDIDDKLQTLVDAHTAIYKSINDSITDIDYNHFFES